MMHPRIEGVLMQLVLQPLLEWSRFLFSLLCALILFGDHSSAHNPMQLDWSRSIVGAARTRGYNRMTFHGRVPREAETGQNIWSRNCMCGILFSSLKFPNI